MLNNVFKYWMAKNVHKGVCIMHCHLVAATMHKICMLVASKSTCYPGIIEIKFMQ